MPIEVRLQDVRRHLEYWALQCFPVEAHRGDHLGGALATVRSAVDALPAGSVVHVGMTKHQGLTGWH
eukprot:6159155-Alexandrium_andersonii.AAC.1